MAPAAIDPPVSVREKGGRIVVVFNVPNVRANSVQVEPRPPNEDEPAGSVHVSFNAVSPNRSFEKHLVLPHGIDGKTVQDVQSKTLTVQLVKLDESQEWGQAWLKPKGKAGKRKSENPGDQKTGSMENSSQKAGEGNDKQENNQKMVEEMKVIHEVPVEEVKVTEEIQEPIPEEKTETLETAQEDAIPVVEEPKEEVPEPAETPEKLRSEPAPAEVATAGGEEHNSKAGVKARARRGKKSKSKEKPEESCAAEEPKEEEKPRKASKKGNTTEVSPDNSMLKGLLQALTQSTASRGAAAGEVRLPVPADPEISRLVSQGGALLQVDVKKAVVLLRLAARKGYLPAYLLLAQHAQTVKDDSLFIESLCALFTSPDVHKQLPKDVLNDVVTQLTAVLRDPKNRHEAEAHAADLDAIAKDWPIMNMLKIQPVSNKSKTSTAKQQAAPKASSKAPSQDFQKIKSAMAPAMAATPVPTKSDAQATPSKPVTGSWQQEGDRWCLSIQAKEDLATAKLDISQQDLRLTHGDGRLLARVPTPQGLDLRKVEASWKKNQSLEVVGPSVKTVQAAGNRYVDQLD